MVTQRKCTGKDYFTAHTVEFGKEVPAVHRNTQNIGVRKISQKPVKVTKSWLIELVNWTNLGSLFGGDETDTWVLRVDLH